MKAHGGCDTSLFILMSYLIWFIAIMGMMMSEFIPAQSGKLKWCLSTRAGDRFYPGRSTDPLNTWMFTCRNLHLCTCITSGIAFSWLLVMGGRYEACSRAQLLCYPVLHLQSAGTERHPGESLWNPLQECGQRLLGQLQAFMAFFTALHAAS